MLDLMKSFVLYTFLGVLSLQLFWNLLRVMLQYRQGVKGDSFYFALTCSAFMVLESMAFFPFINVDYLDLASVALQLSLLGFSLRMIAGLETRSKREIKAQKNIALKLPILGIMLCFTMVKFDQVIYAPLWELFILITHFFVLGKRKEVLRLGFRNFIFASIFNLAVLLLQVLNAPSSVIILLVIFKYYFVFNYFNIFLMRDYIEKRSKGFQFVS